MKLPSFTTKRHRVVISMYGETSPFAERYQSDGSFTFLVDDGQEDFRSKTDVDSSSSSSSSTSSSSSSQNLSGRGRSRTCRRVHFSESPSQVYGHSVPHEDVHDTTVCWYTREEIKMFKTETVCIVKAIINATAQKDASWIKSLQSAYDLFCSQDGQELLSQVTVPCTRATPAILGLDKWVLLSMAIDKANRRAHLVERILVSVDPQVIAQASSFMSRPSRLYAAHVARWCWDNSEEQQQQQQL